MDDLSSFGVGTICLLSKRAIWYLWCLKGVGLNWSSKDKCFAPNATCAHADPGCPEKFAWFIKGSRLTSHLFDIPHVKFPQRCSTGFEQSLVRHFKMVALNLLLFVVFLSLSVIAGLQGKGGGCVTQEQLQVNKSITSILRCLKE